MTRFVWFSLILAITSSLVWGTKSSAGRADSGRPNIVLILADDVGREVLECYGGMSYATPQLDRLARRGMRFTQAHAMAVCHPTRICLLTGRYPFRLGDPKWGTFPEFAEGKTVAHVLKKAGYATAIAGKWQLTLLKDDLEHPQRLGFDTYCLFGWHEGPKYYQPRIWQDGSLRTDVHDRFGPDVYCDFLIDFMKQHKDRPFFAYYSMALCHAVTNDLDKPVPFGPAGRYPSYAEMVVAMDERVGRLARAIDELGLSDNTVLIFIADNGTPHDIIETAVDDRLIYRPVVSKMKGMHIPGGEGIPGGKGQPTDWGTRVPMLACWPGKVPAGAVSDSLVDVSDFLPTFAALTGAPLPNDWPLDGHSFATTLLGESRIPVGASSQRTWVFAQRKRRAFVKNRRWKLYADGRFFDVQRDPWEKDPLFDAARGYPETRPPNKRVWRGTVTTHELEEAMSPEAVAPYRQLERTIRSLGLPEKYGRE